VRRQAGVRWGAPWLGTLALAAGLASATTAALVGAPAAGPDASGPPTPSAATAALADGDDVRASLLARPSGRDGQPVHRDPAASSNTCQTSDGRLLYVGLNSWIVAQPAVAPGADDGCAGQRAWPRQERGG